LAVLLSTLFGSVLDDVVQPHYHQSFRVMAAAIAIMTALLLLPSRKSAPRTPPAHYTTCRNPERIYGGHHPRRRHVRVPFPAHDDGDEDGRYSARTHLLGAALNSPKCSHCPGRFYPLVARPPPPTAEDPAETPLPPNHRQRNERLVKSEVLKAKNIHVEIDFIEGPHGTPSSRSCGARVIRRKTPKT
jgi:hypothetical protein